MFPLLVWDPVLMNEHDKTSKIKTELKEDEWSSKRGIFLRRQRGWVFILFFYFYLRALVLVLHSVNVPRFFATICFRLSRIQLFADKATVLHPTNWDFLPYLIKICVSSVWVVYLWTSLKPKTRCYFRNTLLSFWNIKRCLVKYLYVQRLIWGMYTYIYPKVLRFPWVVYIRLFVLFFFVGFHKHVY